MQFKDVIGQQGLKLKLIESVKTGRVHHAQLFLGDSGHGSLALAMAYAQYLNCENPNDTDSCGVCSNCQKNYKLIHPDVHFSFPIVATKSSAAQEGADPKSNFYTQWRELIQGTAYPAYTEWMRKISTGDKQGNIPVAEARSIIRKLSLKSYQGGYKVLIMWLPEFLGNEGNVLLKVLEEPSPKTIFILVAEDESRILNTILSRCQIIRIPRIDAPEIATALTKFFSAEEDKAKQAAALAEGSFRRALEIFNSGEDNYFETYVAWMRLCFQHDYSALIGWSNNASGWGKENLKNFLIYSLGVFRESLLLKQGISGLSKLMGDEFDWINEKFAPNINQDGVISIVNEINRVHYLIERNANLKIVLYDLSLYISKNLK
ncbi:MAG: ATP-binding protein [Bacteroidia bacterium]